MTNNKKLTAAGIAAVVGISARAVQKALRDAPFEEISGRGGARRLYDAADLPEHYRRRLAEHALGTSGSVSGPSALERQAIAGAIVPAASTAPSPSPVGDLASVDASFSAQAVGRLAQWQIEIATARAALLDECERIAASSAIHVARAAELLCDQARAGTLPPAIADLARMANARRGVKGRSLSVARLFAWRKQARGAVTPAERLARLAPGSRGKKWTLTADVAAALAKFRAPNKPALRWCVKEIVGEDSGPAFNSLYARCRRELKKLPAPVFYPGRHSGAALRALQPFRRREFLSLEPNDVWTGDGHSAKLTIAHPETGNRFVPEVTLTVDVPTRYVVGFSVSVSENCLAVSDALRHAVSRHGVPLIYYSDNGGGQKNKMFDAPITGILGSLGIQHETGIPGNPQGRGVMERIWQTILLPLARRFSTYQGTGADRDTLRKVSRDIDRALRLAQKGEVAALPERLPKFREFIEALDLEIETYNRTHRHRSLPKLDGVNHATPAEYRAHRLGGASPQVPQPQEVAALFMPAERRVAVRGEIKFWNGIYFHPDLMLVDREEVMVSYDIHDASYVLVRKLSGEFIARAELAGNSGAYFPKPMVERLREERAARRLQRLESKIGGVKQELYGSTVRYVPSETTENERAALEAIERDALKPASVNVLELRSDAEKHDHWKLLDERRRAGEQLAEHDEAFWQGWQGERYFAHITAMEKEVEDQQAARRSA